MIKSVTRTLYIDGNPIAAYTQDPWEDSELADIEQIAASLELQEKPKGRAYVGNDAADTPGPLQKGRPKALQFKLKLLQAVSKMLLLGHKASVERHVVCLYVEHHVEPSTEKIMKKTDTPQQGQAQDQAARIRKVGPLGRAWKALQSAFDRVFPPECYILLDTTLPLTSLQQELDSIRQLKRQGYQVRVQYWHRDRELFQQLPCNGCPRQPESQAERSRRQEVVLEILYELSASSPEGH